MVCRLGKRSFIGLLAAIALASAGRAAPGDDRIDHATARQLAAAAAFHDDEAARLRLQRVAATGDMQGEFGLGLYYLYRAAGDVKADEPLILDLIEKGGTRIKEALGRPADNGDARRQALDLLQKAAARGEPESQALIGGEYWQEARSLIVAFAAGDGPRKLPSAAIDSTLPLRSLREACDAAMHWLSLAAGHDGPEAAPAYYALWEIYAAPPAPSRGARRIAAATGCFHDDPALAGVYLRRAAERGHPYSAYMMAVADEKAGRSSEAQRWRMRAYDGLLLAQLDGPPQDTAFLECVRQPKCTGAPSAEVQVAAAAAPAKPDRPSAGALAFAGPVAAAAAAGGAVAAGRLAQAAPASPSLPAETASGAPGPSAAPPAYLLASAAPEPEPATLATPARSSVPAEAPGTVHAYSPPLLSAQAAERVATLEAAPPPVQPVAAAPAPAGGWVQLPVPPPAAQSRPASPPAFPANVAAPPRIASATRAPGPAIAAAPPAQTTARIAIAPPIRIVPAAPAPEPTTTAAPPAQAPVRVAVAAPAPQLAAPAPVVAFRRPAPGPPIVRVSAVAPEVDAYSEPRILITRRLLYLRAGPGFGAPPLYLYPAGAEVEVTGAVAGGPWLRARFDDIEGYVLGSGLVEAVPERPRLQTASAPAAPVVAQPVAYRPAAAAPEPRTVSAAGQIDIYPRPYLRVVARPLYSRSQPGGGSAPMRLFHPGEVVEVIGAVRGQSWYLVRMGNSEGFVMGSAFVGA